MLTLSKDISHAHKVKEIIGESTLQNKKAFRFRLSAVKESLEKAGIRWVVFAGAAAYCYGSRREVTDFDILVKTVDLEKARAVLQNMDKEGFDVVAAMEIRTNQGICRFFLDDEMIGRTRWMQLFGVTIPVIPVEDNIIFKAILQRGETQGKHDLEDIKHMIKNEKLDLEYLKKRIQKCQAEKKVKPLLNSLIPNI